MLGFPSSLEAQPDSGAQARDASPSSDAGWEILARHPGDGEQCLVCKQPIEGEPAVEIRYKGRVFHVKESMMDDFRADPEAYFRSMQARSGLFDEAAMPERPMRTGWLAFGVYLVIGLLFGAICGSVAMGRSRPALPWFFAGLAGNVIALGVLLLTTSAEEGGAAPVGLRKVPRTRAPRPCPHCGATNHPSARACSSCGGALEPKAPAETERVPTA